MFCPENWPDQILLHTGHVETDTQHWEIIPFIPVCFPNTGRWCTHVTFSTAEPGSQVSEGDRNAFGDWLCDYVQRSVIGCVIMYNAQSLAV